MSNPLPLTDVSDCAHSAVVGAPLSESEAAGVASVFKALADPVRLRLLSVIASREGREACVCDVSAGIELSQPTISHHLKVLRTAGLLDSERRGSWVYYRITPDTLRLVADLLGSYAHDVATT